MKFFDPKIYLPIWIVFDADDDFILMYLRGCKYSLEKVKKKIDMWHTVRTHCPDLFDGWSYKDAKMKELIHAGYSINDLGGL